MDYLCSFSAHFIIYIHIYNSFISNTNTNIIHYIYNNINFTLITYLTLVQTNLLYMSYSYLATYIPIHLTSTHDSF